MKNSWHLLLMLILAIPAYAQETPPDETVTDDPVVETEPAEPVAEQAEAVDTVPVDVAEEEPAETEPSKPWRLYAGVDQVNSLLSVSGLPSGSPSRFDSGIYRLRAGTRLSDNIGFEFHYGIEQDAEPGEITTDNYYGLYLAASTSLYDTLGLSFPVGYARSSFSGGGASTDLDSVAFGLEAELPLKTFGETLPDLRLVLGWMTYYQKRDARLYGANLGLRYDFTIGGGGGGASE